MRSRFIVGLLIAATLSLCSCSTVRSSGEPTTSISLDALSSIATPDHAELALFTATKIFETVVGAINRANAIRPLPRYDEYVSGSGSRANKVQASLRVALMGIDLWRGSGDRLAFDRSYSAAKSSIDDLAKFLTEAR